MTNNKTLGPVEQAKQTDNQRPHQFNECSSIADITRDTQGHVLNPQKVILRMATYESALSRSCRNESHDRPFLASGLPLPLAGQETRDQSKSGSTATSLSESESWEQASAKDCQPGLFLLGDETLVKPLNSKRPAEECKGSNKRSRTSMTTDTNKRLERFACPYYRKDPERHLDCINLKLLRISDVKQHLKRRHAPSYSCFRCSEGFASSKEHKDHVLQQTCATTDNENINSVSPAAQEALKYRVGRTSSSECQWHEINKILFGNPRQSLNPYHDGIFKEITGIIRGIWKDQGQDIISSLSETRNVPCADQLGPLLSEILIRIEDCFERKGKKHLKHKQQERLEITPFSSRGSSEEGKREPNYESLGAQGLEDSNGALEIDETYHLAMQDWQFPADFGTPDNIFNYSILPAFQNEQAEDQRDGISTGLANDDERGNWPSMGTTSTGVADNIMSHQNSDSVKDCIFADGDLTTAQIPTTFD
ncbi:uncharacterized protein FPRN_11168 [Fusarium proliferatum]|nr:uncharacterized protein FPRN_11168 [Fusarium proliferatum]